MILKSTLDMNKPDKNVRILLVGERKLVVVVVVVEFGDLYFDQPFCSTTRWRGQNLDDLLAGVRGIQRDGATEM